MRGTVAVVILLALVSLPACLADEIWVPRFEQQGNLMVPIRPVFEPFGAQIGWDAVSRAVTITAPAMNIVLRVNSPTASVNGAPVALPVPPREYAGATYVPFSFAETVLEGKIEYLGDRIAMPTVGRTLMLRGTPATTTYQPPAQPPASGPITITQPTDGSMIGPRVEVYGTAPPRSLVIIETEVRRQDNDELLRAVPGIRHYVPASGNWHFSVAAPELPPNVAEPLYYVINARYRLGGQESQPVSVRVYRQQ